MSSEAEEAVTVEEVKPKKPEEKVEKKKIPEEKVVEEKKEPLKPQGIDTFHRHFAHFCLPQIVVEQTALSFCVSVCFAQCSVKFVCRGGHESEMFPKS